MEPTSLNSSEMNTLYITIIMHPHLLRYKYIIIFNDWFSYFFLILSFRIIFMKTRKISKLSLMRMKTKSDSLLCITEIWNIWNCHKIKTSQNIKVKINSCQYLSGFSSWMTDNFCRNILQLVLEAER